MPHAYYGSSPAREIDVLGNPVADSIVNRPRLYEYEECVSDSSTASKPTFWQRIANLFKRK